MVRAPLAAARADPRAGATYVGRAIESEGAGAAARAIEPGGTSTGGRARALAGTRSTAVHWPSVSHPGVAEHVRMCYGSARN